MSQRLIFRLLLSLACFVACDRKADSAVSTPAGDRALTGSSAGTGAPPAPTPSVTQVNPAFPPPLDLTTPPADATRSSTGLVSKQLRAGTGTAHLTAEDYADVRYTVWRDDGSLFASTKDGYQRLDLARQVAGLREALLLMTEGERRQAWVPYSIAFGSMPHVINAPKTGLVYELELVKIARKPAVPADVAAPPSTALRTPSGLRSRVINPGHGTRHPTDQSRVELRYSSFTPDGKMYESSYTKGNSITAKLSMVMDGWREGLKLMVEGERRVLWIPAKLAHGERVPGQPSLPFEPPRGAVVMDVELLKILEP